MPDYQHLDYFLREVQKIKINDLNRGNLQGASRAARTSGSGTLGAGESWGTHGAGLCLAAQPWLTLHLRGLQPLGSCVLGDAPGKNTAMPSSRGTSQPVIQARSLALQMDSLQTEHQENPNDSWSLAFLRRFSQREECPRSFNCKLLVTLQNGRAASSMGTWNVCLNWKNLIDLWWAKTVADCFFFLCLEEWTIRALEGIREHRSSLDLLNRIKVLPISLPLVVILFHCSHCFPSSCQTVKD